MIIITFVNSLTLNDLGNGGVYYSESKKVPFSFSEKKKDEYLILIILSYIFLVFSLSSLFPS